jgi:antitoxin CcdA
MRISRPHPEPTMARPSNARKATNLSLPPELIEEARSFGVNLSQVCEQALRTRIAQERERRWRIEHGEFVDAYNRTVAEDGLPLDRYRGF